MKYIALDIGNVLCNVDSTAQKRKIVVGIDILNYIASIKDII
jgi:hypothetical protein